jgi:predicted nucleic acid-binding protein
MNLYLDTSALVKRYIVEIGSADVNRWIDEARLVATSVIARAEANAAFARAVRTGAVTRSNGEKAVQALATHWPKYVRTLVVENTTIRAAELAWTLGLRGYDAIHLASAEALQSTLGASIIFVTYDRQLAVSSRQIGFETWPS